MDATAQQRLVEVVAQAYGVPTDAIVADAIVLARRLEAYRLPAESAREISDLEARVELAVTRFRGGDLESATSHADVVLERLRSRPGLPMASSMAWTIHVLRGRIAWTQADEDAAADAWAAAVAVDPRAQLSGREVPPDVVAAYEAVRQRILSERDRWFVPTFGGASVEGAQIEIDGVGGLRPVPPGEHFVVVHWAGAPAHAAVITTGAVVLPPPQVSIGPGLPSSADAADLLCDALSLDVLVMARMRDGRVGVQAYDCDGDFGVPWYSERPAADTEALDSLVTAPWAPDGFAQPRGVLLDPAPWPMPEPEVPAVVEPRGTTPTPRPIDTQPAAKPWFRRAWIWVVAGAVVAGAVTTGVVLGTREPSSSVVVTDDFLRP